MENVISMVVYVLWWVVLIILVTNLVAKVLRKKIDPLDYEKKYFIAFAIAALAEAIDGATNVYYGEPFSINAIFMWIFGVAFVSSYFEIRRILKGNQKN